MTHCAERARHAYFMAEQESDAKAKQQLYLQSAQHFTEAAEELRALLNPSDSGGASCSESSVAALIYLAANAARKANQTRALLSNANNGDNRPQRSPRNDHVAITSTGSASSCRTGAGSHQTSLQGGLLELSLHDNKLMSSAIIRNRISGVKEVAKSRAPTSAAVVNDIMLMESKLSEIGIMRKMNTLTQSILSASSAISSSQQASTFGLQSKYSSQASSLGESFMILNDFHKQKSSIKGTIKSKGAVSKSSVQSSSALPDHSAGSRSPKASTCNNDNVTESTSMSDVKRGASSLYDTQFASTNHFSGISNNTAAYGVDPIVISPAGSSYGGQTITAYVGGKAAASFDPLEVPYNPAQWANRLFGFLTSPFVANEMSSTADSPMMMALASSQQQLDPFDKSVLWNEQSTLLPHQDDSQIQVAMQQQQQQQHQYMASHRSRGDMLSSSAMNASIMQRDTDNGYDSNSVLRLLQSIKRLGEENANLLKKLESYSSMEANHAIVKREMMEFKEEYAVKLNKVREELTKFQKRYPSADNPANIIATPAIIRSQHSFDIAADGTDKVSTSSRVGSNPAADSSTPVTSKEYQETLLHKNQLEKLVESLVGRLETLESENKKKDSKIKKYEAVIQQAKARKSLSLGPVGSSLPTTDDATIGSSGKSSAMNAPTPPVLAYPNAYIPESGSRAVTRPIIRSEGVIRAVPVSSQSPRHITSTIRENKDKQQPPKK